MEVQKSHLYQRFRQLRQFLLYQHFREHREQQEMTKKRIMSQSMIRIQVVQHQGWKAQQHWRMACTHQMHLTGPEELEKYRLPVIRLRFKMDRHMQHWYLAVIIISM